MGPGRAGDRSAPEILLATGGSFGLNHLEPRTVYTRKAAKLQRCNHQIKSNWILSWLWKMGKERHEAALKRWRTCVMGSDQMSPSKRKSKWFPCHILSHLYIFVTPSNYARLVLGMPGPELAVTCRRPVGPFCSCSNSTFTSRGTVGPWDLQLWCLGCCENWPTQTNKKHHSSRRGAWFQPRISPWWPGDTWDKRVIWETVSSVSKSNRKATWTTYTNNIKIKRTAWTADLPLDFQARLWDLNKWQLNAPSETKIESNGKIRTQNS